MKYFLIITLMIAMSIPITCIAVMTDSYEIPFIGNVSLKNGNALTFELGQQINRER